MPPVIRQAPILCPGHTRPVVDLCFSSQTEIGSLFISGGKDGKAILRRGDTGDWIGSFVGHQGAIWTCVLDAQGTKAATGSADFTATVWDTATGQALVSVSEEHVVRCVDLSRTDDGGRLLTANNSKHIAIYDLANPDKALARLKAHGQIIRRVSWCDQDRHVLTASEDGTLKLWDLKSSAENAVLSAPLDSRIFSHPILDFQFRQPLEDQTTGSTTLAIACGKEVSILNVDWRNQSPSLSPSEDHITRLPMTCAVHSVSLHPSTDMLVCGGMDHYLYRIDRFTGEVLDKCKGHFGPVHCVRFSPDGHVFASGSEDGTVRLWQTEVGEEYGLWRLITPAAVNKKAEPVENSQNGNEEIKDQEEIVPE